MKDGLRGPLDENIALYLAHKRSLGKQLTKAEGMLRLLDTYLAVHGVSELQHIAPVHLEAFVASRPRPSARSYNVLIGNLRGFLDWLVAHEILPKSPLRCRPRRAVAGRRPFLFNLEQARRLLKVAGQLPDTRRAQARGETFRVIFALMYGLGLRIGEVTRLRRQDVDLENELLIIRRTKFGKDRLVPFGPKLAHTLSDFLKCEEARCGVIPPESPVFSFRKKERAPMSQSTIRQTFYNLLPAIPLSVPPGVAPPNPHCLRHSFAVGTLLRWYRAGLDPMSRLLDLSTFLGHVSIYSTAVYLTITTDLLEAANHRFAHFAASSRKEGLR